ncbi:MAG TPA: glycosyltransferase family 4 protein [Ignavibacteria bacterium]|nr:glycosyltransferase family 4 protein [Ignavibacteria bacterium]
MNLLFLTDELNYADGVSTQLFYLLSGLKKKKNLKISLICSGGDAGEKFLAAGIDVLTDENLNHRSRSIKGFLSALRSVAGHCKANSVNIIHSHNHYAANIASTSLKIRLSGNIRTVQTVHGIIPETGKLDHLSASAYISVNDHVYKYLKDKIRDEKKINLIYNGIDTGENKDKKYNSRLKFISAGRLDKGKRVEIFIKAVSMLPDSIREKADFMIAGDGEKYAALKKLDEDLNTGIEFTGQINDLRKFFKDCDVYVMTSGSEGLPMTILEAAAEKVMVISAAFDGIENIIKDNSEGLIFPVDNADELSEKIRFTIENPETVITLTGNFYRSAAVKFDSDLMAGKYYELYKKLLIQ